MVLLGELVVGLLDLFGVGVLGHAQNLVVILLGVGTRGAKVDATAQMER